MQVMTHDCSYTKFYYAETEADNETLIKRAKRIYVVCNGKTDCVYFKVAKKEALRQIWDFDAAGLEVRAQRDSVNGEYTVFIDAK